MSEPPEEEFGLQLFDEVVAAFNQHQVEFMIIGGFAVIYHGHVRATEDLDLFIGRSADNARRAAAALNELSGGELGLSEEVFTAGKGVLIGAPPLKIDVLSEIAGVSFEEAWSKRLIDLFGSATVNYISREHLIANKRAAGRPKDLDDARELEKGAH